VAAPLVARHVRLATAGLPAFHRSRPTLLPTLGVAQVRQTDSDAHWEFERRQLNQPHPLGDVVERGCTRGWPLGVSPR
jgi:hypothetical protein